MYDEAANSEGAAALQTLKTMDSIETKINQMKVAFQEFYTSTGVQNLIKGIIDFITSLINRFNDFSKAFGKFPVVALSLIGNLIVSVKSISSNLISFLIGQLDVLKEQIHIKIEDGFKEGAEAGIREIATIEIGSGENAEEEGKSLGTKIGKGIGMGLQSVGTILTMIGLSQKNDTAAGITTMIGGALGGVGQGLMTGFSIGGPWGALAGVITGLLNALPGIVSGWQLWNGELETTEEKLERLEDELKKEKEDTVIAKSELDSLTSYREKLLAAKEAQYESAEAKQEYIDLSNEIAAQFPSLIAGYDAEGNAVISLAEDYQALLGAKTAVYQKELTEQQDAEMKIWEDRAAAAAKIAEERGVYTNQTKLYMKHGLEWEDANIAWAKQVGYRTLQSSNLDFSEAFVEGAMSEIDTSDWTKATSKHILGAFGANNFTEELAPQMAEALGGKKVTDLNKEGFTIGNLGYVSLGTLKSAKKDAAAHSINMEGLIRAYAEALEGTREVIDGEIQVKGEEFLVTGNFSKKDLSLLQEKIYKFSFDPNSLLSQLYEERKVVEEQILKQAQNSQKKYAKNMAQASAAMYDTEYNLVQEGIWGEIFTERYQDYLDQASNTEDGLIDGKTAAQKLNEDATALSVRVTNFLSANAIQINKANDYLKNLSTLSQSEVDDYLSSNFKDAEGNLTELGTYLNNIVQSQLQDFKATKALIEIAFGTKYKAEGEDKEKFHLDEELENLVNSIDTAFIETFHKQLIHYKDLMDNVETKERGGNAQAAYLALINQITQLDDELQAKAYAILQNGDITTLTRIFSIVEELAQLDPAVFGESGAGGASLAAILENHVFNLETEWATYKEKVAQNLTTLENKLKQAFEGMSLTDALTFIDEFDLDLTDLQLKDSKFFFNNTDLLIKKYTEQSQKVLEALNSETERILNEAGYDEDITQFTRNREQLYKESSLSLKEAQSKQEGIKAYIESLEKVDFSSTPSVLGKTRDKYFEFSGGTKEERDFKNALAEEFRASNFEGTFGEYLENKITVSRQALQEINTQIAALEADYSEKKLDLSIEQAKKEYEILKTENDALVEILTDYEQQYKSFILLSNGQINEFLEYAKTKILPNLTEEDWAKIQTALSTGDFSGLSGDLLSFVSTYSEGYQEALANITESITESALGLLKNPTNAKGVARTASFNAENLQTVNPELYNALLDETGAVELTADGKTLILKDIKALSDGTARLLAMQYDTIEEANNFMAAYFADNSEAYKDAWVQLLSGKSSFTENELIEFASSIGESEEKIREYFKETADGVYELSRIPQDVAINLKDLIKNNKKLKQDAVDDALSILKDIYENNGLYDLEQINDLEKTLNEAEVDFDIIEGILAIVRSGQYTIGEYYKNIEEVLKETNISLEEEAEYLEYYLKEKNKDIELRSSQFEKLLKGRAKDETAINALYENENLRAALEAGGYSGDGFSVILEELDILNFLRAIGTDGADALGMSLGEIEDTIQSILTNWATLLSKGISGILTNKDFESLSSEFGIGADQTIQTANGLQLTQAAVFSVYEQLKAMDSMTAQLTLKEMADSARDADKELNDVFKVQKKINKLQAENNKEQKTHLELLQRIQRDIISEGNAFNFMNAEIPTEITNPLSAWEGMSQALQVLQGEDFKEGRISYENFRAMMQMVDSSNLTVGGLSVNQLMQQAWDALKFDATNGTYIDLTDFTISAEDIMLGLVEAMRGVAEVQKELSQARADFSKSVEDGSYDPVVWANVEKFSELSQPKQEYYKATLDNAQAFYEGMQKITGTAMSFDDFSKIEGWTSKLSEVYQTLRMDYDQGIEKYIAVIAEAEVAGEAFAKNAAERTAEATEAMAKALTGETLLEGASEALNQLNEIQQKLEELQSQGYTIDLIYNISSQQAAQDGTYSVTIEDNGTAKTLSTLATALLELEQKAGHLTDALEKVPDKSIEVQQTADAINSLQSRIITARINVSVNEPGAASVSSTSFSLSSTRATAMAKGTLMGELGPELVSANGHYFTVGNNGAEFVNLPSDAIVFNHLQTKKLLGSGSISSTGKPVTNERKAVARAKGTAMASASVHKETSALWNRLMGFLGDWNWSDPDGAGAGGGSEATATHIHDLERWYNLLRQIEKLEQQINLRQQERESFASGYDYVASLEKELDLLRKQQSVYSQLANLQKDFYDRRREDLLSTDYAKIFTYDADGLMQYVDGKGYGLDILATLNQTNAHGAPMLTNKQQVEYLQERGFNIANLMTKADGTKVSKTDYAGIMEIFWNGIDSWMNELDNLYDEYNDHIISIEENQAAQLEILQEYIDNQRSIEDKLLEAIINREEAEIEKLQENLDAMQKATSQYIEGLNRSLQKEREMYEENKQEEETIKLQRQLSILQRTGGSASEIKSLQDQLDSRLQDSYFYEQEKQIQAIQEASNLQLEKLQNQIDIMNESLEYQKENGLLWQEVSNMMMSWTPEKMLQFIETYTSSYREDSLLENEEKSKETLKELEIWYAKQQENGRGALWETYLKDAGNRYDKETIERSELRAKEAFLSVLRSNGTEDAAQQAADEVFSNVTQTKPAPEPEKPTTEDSTSQGNYYVATYSSLLGANKRTVGHLTEAEARRAALAAIDADTETYFLNNPNVPKTSYIYQSIAQWKKAITVKKYAKGGLVDYTGPAWVDGTKAKPEAFLSAEDTALLKSKIFSNSNYSLKSAIESIQALGATISKSYIQHENEGVVIENVTVQIQTSGIASDYDARRAGELALDELMKIARRSSNIGVARR